MKRKISKRINSALYWLVFAVLIPCRLQAQIIVPFYYGVTNSLVDERGVMLEGTAFNPGDRVQLLRADTGIYPPALDGSPHPANPILAETRIGVGTDSAAGAIGKFASSVNINRYEAIPMFVRVFNGYSPSNSSFYGNSQIFTNSTSVYGTFIARLKSTSLPLDSRDPDNDYLSNSWEQSWGTNPINPDSDSDGVLDGEEIVAGTNPLDRDDYLRMVEISATLNGTTIVGWSSVTNKIYQVEYQDEVLSGAGSYMHYGEPVQATGSWSWQAITNAMDITNPVFRVRIVTP